MGGRRKARLVVGEFLSEAKEGPCPSPQTFHHIADSFCPQGNEVQGLCLWPSGCWSCSPAGGGDGVR